MFASVRRYRLTRGSMDELVSRVDRGFAEQISAAPGFVSYEFVDCGDGELATISVFETMGQAEESRELAQRWTDGNLRDLEFARLDALRGEVCVSRAVDDMLAPGHAEDTAKFASIRQYSLRSGDVGELMHIVDEVFADEISLIHGFEAYHALDCGRGGVVTVSMFMNLAGAEQSDDHALRFVQAHLSAFDIERTHVLGGEVRVSRALAGLLEPAHA